MTEYGQINYFDLEGFKTYFMDEAWEYFKKRENLSLLKDRLYFELHEKNQNLKEKWGAFKHTYTSAAFTRLYGKNAAKRLGDMNEVLQFGTVKSSKHKKDYNPGNEPQDRRMDLKNNKAGREIAAQKSGLKLLDEVYYALENNDDIVLNQYINNDTPFKDDNKIMDKIWNVADKAYYETKDTIKKEKKTPNQLETGLYNTKPVSKYDDLFLSKQIDSDKPLSLKEKLVRAREEKLARYTQRLKESPEKVAQREEKHVSLEELKAPQEAKKKRVRDIIEGKVEFDENVDLSAYENKESKDNKIFTQEEIDSMSPEDKKKNRKAVLYQKRTIGIPAKEQADKAVSKGGMVYVSGYTRADGTQVKSYYRSR